MRRLSDYTKIVRDFYQDITQNKPASTKDLTTEKAKSGKTEWGMQLLDPNPDDLLTAKGKGVKTYQDMLREPYVKAGLRDLKLEILASPWKIVPASDSQDDIDKAALLEHNLRNLDGQTFIETLYGILDALDCGYSITEKIMKVVPHGYDYNKFKSLDTYYYKYGTDDYSNIVDIVAENVKGLMTGQERFDKRFFITYANMPRYSNPYGTAELRAAYRAFWIKDTAWKFRSIYLERYGVPALIGTVRAGTPETDKDDLLAVMKQMQTEACIVIPADMKIEALEIAMAPTSEYESAIDQLNKDILIGIMGSFMTVDVGAKTGARAHAEVHENVMVKTARYMSNQLEAVVDAQAVREWYDFNFAGTEYGKFQFIREEDFEREAESRVLGNLVKAGVKRIPVKDIMDKYGYRMADDDEEVLIAPAGPVFGRKDADGDGITDEQSDDVKLIELREAFWPRFSGVLTTISAECFEAIKKAEVLSNGDILKAKDMALPINVKHVKLALSDVMALGHLLGRGAEADVGASVKDRDAQLYEHGMTADEFSETMHRYEDEAYRLAGRLRDGLQADFRRELLSAVAGGGTEQTLWEKFSEIVTDKHGIGNYSDAVDVEAVSLGYNDGLKERTKAELVR